MNNLWLTRSNLELCYSDAPVESALHLKGGDGACYSDIHNGLGNYCHSTLHCADDMDTADVQMLKNSQFKILDSGSKVTKNCCRCRQMFIVGRIVMGSKYC